MTAPAFDPTLLQPGDTMLYRPTSFSIKRMAGWFFGRLIALKTWRNVSHVEIYVGNGVFATAAVQAGGQRVTVGRTSFASRDGLGVDAYPVRLTELAYVLRPVTGERVDLVAGLYWFTQSAQGQKYDWLGLTRFVRTSIQPSRTRMFCSAFWLRYYRACGFNPFSARVDADSIAPGEILTCPKLEVVWEDGQDVDLSDLVAVHA